MRFARIAAAAALAASFAARADSCPAGSVTAPGPGGTTICVPQPDVVCAPPTLWHWDTATTGHCEMPGAPMVHICTATLIYRPEDPSSSQLGLSPACGAPDAEFALEAALARLRWNERHPPQ